VAAAAAAAAAGDSTAAGAVAAVVAGTRVCYVRLGLCRLLLWACPATAAGDVTCQTTCSPTELPLLLLLQFVPPVCQYKLEILQGLQLPHGPVAVQLQVQNPAVANSSICQNLDAGT
jgi:hypothetical protein